MPENQETVKNNNNLTYQNKEVKLTELSKKTAKLLRPYHLNYDQTKFLFREVRKYLELSPVKKKQKIILHLTAEELTAIIKQGYKAKYAERGYGLLVKTMTFTGTRVSELVNINVNDILWEENTIKVSGKGNKERFVPLFEFLKQELRSYVGSREVGYLFESNRHTKFTRHRVLQIVKELAEKCGINKRVYNHLFRHSISTYLHNKGMPLEDIQKMLGHSDPKTTQIYAKSSMVRLLENYNKALSNQF